MRRKNILNIPLILGNILAIMSLIFYISMHNGYIEASEKVFNQTKFLKGAVQIKLTDVDLKQLMSGLEIEFPKDVFIFTYENTINGNYKDSLIFIGNNKSTFPFEINKNLEDITGILSGEYLEGEKEVEIGNQIVNIYEIMKPEIKNQYTRNAVIVPFKILSESNLKNIQKQNLLNLNIFSETTKVDDVIKYLKNNSIESRTTNSMDTVETVRDESIKVASTSLIFILLSFFNSIIAMIFWIKKRRIEIALMKAIGIRKDQILYSIFYEVLSNLILAIILSLGLTLLAGNLMQSHLKLSIRINIFSIIYPVLIYSVISILLTLVISGMISRINSPEILGEAETTLWLNFLEKT